MNAQSFLDNFHTIALAPGGVSRMRDLVYFFAITGGLSRPEAGDSDANLILDDSLQAKLDYYEENSVRQGARKHSEIFQVVKRVPNHWVMVSAGDLIHLINGRAFKSTDWRKSGLPIIRIQNLNNATAPFNYFQGEVAEGHRVRAGDMLLSWSGTPGTSFGAFIWNGGDALLNQHIFKVAIYSSKISKEYLRMAINASLDALIGSARGGVGLKHVTKGQIESLQIPLPPLEEQKRIVAKVDELMRLCDRLQAQQQERETLLPLLSRANHTRFVTKPTDSNLQTIFHQSGSVMVADLRQTIRDLAIRGRLVEQRPSDTPVETLLERISAVRSESGLNARRSQRNSTIGQIASAQFETPDTWAWVFLGDVLINRDGERIPVSKEERAKRKKVYDYYGASGIIDKIDAYLFNKPLLLIGEDGANLINRSTPIAFMARGEYWVNNHAHVLDGISEDFLRYIELFINAINLEAYVTGTAQPKMNQAQMNRIPIALPPIEEQIRIVAKVDELMRLCDQLESQISDRTATCEAFAKAAIAAITSTEFTENEKMRPPKTEVVTALKVTKEPKTTDKAPLASLLFQHGGEVSAKALWKQSNFSEIDAFYRQLKTEMANGWIEEDTSKREVKEVEVD